MMFPVHNQSGDRFVVKMRISDSSAARLYFEHFIFKLPDDEVCCCHPCGLVVPFSIFLILVLRNSILLPSPSWKLGPQQFGSTKTIVPFEYQQRLDLKWFNSFAMRSPTKFSLSQLRRNKSRLQCICSLLLFILHGFFGRNQFCYAVNLIVFN